MTVNAHRNSFTRNDLSIGSNINNQLPPVSIHSTNRLMPSKTMMTGLHTAKVGPTDGHYTPPVPSSRRCSISTKHISPTAHDILLDRFQVQKKEDGLSVRGVAITANCHVIVVLFGTLFIIAGLVFSVIAYREQDGDIETESVQNMLHMLKIAGPILVIFGIGLDIFGCFLCALGWRLKRAERMQEYSFRFPMHLKMDPSTIAYGEKLGEALTPLEGSFFPTPVGSRRASFAPPTECWYNSPGVAQALERRMSREWPTLATRRASIATDVPLPTRKASINPVPTAYWSRPATPATPVEKGLRRSGSALSETLSEGSVLDLGAYDIWTQTESCFSVISSHPDAYFGSDDSLSTTPHEVASFPDRPNSNWSRILGSVQKTSMAAKKFKNIQELPAIKVTSDSPTTDETGSQIPAFKITKMQSAAIRAITAKERAAQNNKANDSGTSKQDQ